MKSGANTLGIFVASIVLSAVAYGGEVAPGIQSRLDCSQETEPVKQCVCDVKNIEDDMAQMHKKFSQDTDDLQAQSKVDPKGNMARYYYRLQLVARQGVSDTEMEIWTYKFLINHQVPACEYSCGKRRQKMEDTAAKAQKRPSKAKDLAKINNECQKRMDHFTSMMKDYNSVFKQADAQYQQQQDVLSAGAMKAANVKLIR